MSGRSSGCAITWTWSPAWSAVPGTGGTSAVAPDDQRHRRALGKGQLLQRHPGHHQGIVYIERHQLALERLRDFDGQHRLRRRRLLALEPELAGSAQATLPPGTSAFTTTMKKTRSKSRSAPGRAGQHREGREHDRHRAPEPDPADVEHLAPGIPERQQAERTPPAAGPRTASSSAIAEARAAPPPAAGRGRPAGPG